MEWVKAPRIWGLVSFFIFLFFIQFFMMGPIGYAAPSEGKGGKGKAGDNDNNSQGKALGQEKNDRSNPSAEANTNRGANRSESVQEVQRDSPSSSRSVDKSESARSVSQETKIGRLHEHLGRKNIEASDQSSTTKEAKDSIKLSKAFSHGAYGLTGERPEHGKDVAHGHLKELLKSLNKFEHARWNYNPNDTRGQGNMGKVDMRDPYGFDKGSGREGSERGRAIHAEEPEVTLDLVSLLAMDWQINDWYLWVFQYWLNYYQSHASSYSPEWYAYAISYVQGEIAYYSSLPYVSISTIDPNPLRDDPTTINYTLSFDAVPTNFEGTTLLVTTTLSSINEYNAGYWAPDGLYGLKWVMIHYDAGEVVVSETDEVALSDSGAITYSYDPSTNLVSWNGNYFELAVTVTEPVSGATYTTTYDKQIYLWRCPYGVVYDKKTGKPIAGATVTVHNVDGSIVVLDKASNPNASNPQITDATGRYNCKLAIGKKYYLSVKTPGYETYKSTVFSERWHVVREDVGLVPLSRFAAE